MKYIENPVVTITSTIEVELCDEFESEEELLQSVQNDVGEDFDMNKGEITVNFGKEEIDFHKILRLIEKEYGLEEGELDYFMNKDKDSDYVSQFEEAIFE